jgi:peptide-methionine (S)-S-oxide reductase
VGYAGGTTPDPTYRSIGDHTEVFQVDFDPERISYEELLEVFWTEHDPTARSYSTQYKATVLAATDEQFEQAERSRDALAARTNRSIQTEIRRLDRFYVAEDYHQKYALRGNKLLAADMQAHYPDEADFRESTAAARLNGYAYGLGSSLQLEREIESFGLTKASEERLREIVRR